MRRSWSNFLARLLLNAMAANFTFRPSLRKYLRWRGGWLDFSVGFKTEDGTVEQAIVFGGGKARVKGHIPASVDVTLTFADESVLREMLRLPPHEVFNLLLKNRMRTEGNLAYLNLFNFLTSVLLRAKHRKLAAQAKETERQRKRELLAKTGVPANVPCSAKPAAEKPGMKGERTDPGVVFLSEPYLSRYSLTDFPRLGKFLDIHFAATPEVCPERPKLMTDWFAQNGFAAQGLLGQARAFHYLLANKKPIIRDQDLIAGTTTTKEIGVVIYPDAHGTLIWGELKSAAERLLNPYLISDETAAILHHEVFPFWARNNFREWVRQKYGNPLCQKLDERFAVYFLWKTVALSHTIADFPKLLRMGTKGMIAEIDGKLRADPGQELLHAMKLCLEGIGLYAGNLAREAKRLEEKCRDPRRRQELARLAEICGRVPVNPCETLDEAVNAIWIVWVALHMENTNAGLSLGRMDQWLEPYFAADMQKLSGEAEREEYVKKAVELLGCFYLRCTDHLPLIPDLGNYLFGGSSSDQVITLGGEKRDGTDAVNDMTYVFLKVTEMLAIRDPNVNARYQKGVNSDTYLRRLCEVNLVTTATPSMHSDAAVTASLEGYGYEIEDIRDWAATGCVEPTLSGKHMGHTNCMMLNMVAALEMALNDGYHPLMRWQVGPSTGTVDFPSFEEFFAAFSAQLGFLFDQAVAYNNMLGEAHAVIRPTPLLSSLLDGPLASGKDVTRGGAKYNSSGCAFIGLADVTDSLMAIKKLVYEEKRVGFAELKKAIDDNFVGHERTHALATKKVPLFGSGNEEAVAMAGRVAKLVHEMCRAHTNFRGGRYTAGFWSMSNHVAFGTLSGALPSGRKAGKAFTPGLTPQPHASKNLLDNIRDVARLDPKYMGNNIAFNVKVVPGNDRDKAVETIFSYVKSYFDLGGMQIQLNVVTSDTLRDAMLNPDQYRNLLVRISGYNAYFVTLNRDMQIELIERAQYGL